MYQRARRTVYRLLTPDTGGRIGVYVDLGIMSLIVTNVVVVVLETVDPLFNAAPEFFYWFEVFTVVVFTLEYVGRIWSCVEAEAVSGPVSGRLDFATRPLLIIDLVAIAPFYAAGLGFVADLRFVRALRLVRLLRVLKLERYSKSLTTFERVFLRQRELLVGAVFVNGLLLTVASSLMYVVEHPVQPEKFSSIPVAMWWGIMTLTTVGYGDVYPVTALGRVLGAIVAFLGIGMFALPASILASGLMKESRRTHERADGGPDTCPHCGREIREDDT